MIARAKPVTAEGKRYGKIVTFTADIRLVALGSYTIHVTTDRDVWVGLGECIGTRADAVKKFREWCADEKRHFNF